MDKQSFWAPWQTLAEGHGFSLISLKETLLGGQCFDWKTLTETHWRGKLVSTAFECRWEENTIQWRHPGAQIISPQVVENYFWLDDTYKDAVDELPWRSDPVLQKSLNYFSGMRILRQPIDETLFNFLLSSAKSIPQIQSIGDAVCKEYGKKLFDGVYSFPGWEKLADVPEADLRSLKLGYRAKYVVKTARFIANEPAWLDYIKAESYEEAKNELLRLPGVGEKVADCVLLFGGHFMEAFPMDTWIEKSLEKRYFLKEWKTSQKIHFARIHFGNFAGLAQQFLFSAERLGILDKK